MGAGGVPSTGGVVGTGGAPSTGGVVGTGGALPTGGVVATGGVLAGGAGGVDGSISSGGVVGTDGALPTGGIGGAVDAREGGTSADSPGEAGTGSSKNILDLVPRANTVSGWTVDPQNTTTSGVPAATATTEIETEALIDGAAANFYMAPYTPKVFAWQNYVNSTLPAAPEGARLSLFILQMPSVAQATGIYEALLQSPLYSRQTGTPNDWQAPSPPVGTESRIQDTGSQWWINFHKDVFYVEVSLDPSYGPAPDYMPGWAVTVRSTVGASLVNG